MKFVVPIRGVESTLHEVLSCHDEFDRFSNEVDKFNGNKSLIDLLNGNDEDKYALRDIEFKFIDDPDTPEARIVAENYPYRDHSYFDFILVIDFYFDSIQELSSQFFHGNEYLRRLSLLLNLIYGTPFTFIPGVAVEGKRFVRRTESVFSDSDWAYVSSRDMGWPSILPLDYDKVLSWFVDNRINLFGKSKNPGWRALNAYSHLFYKIDEESNGSLFWCMLGLEALYCDQRGNVFNQLRERSILILGKPQNFTRSLNRLYNYRSRLIHGDLDLTPKHGGDYEVFQREYNRNVSLACSMLIASLKHLIHNDMTSFQFQLSWIHN